MAHSQNRNYVRKHNSKAANPKLQKLLNEYPMSHEVAEWLTLTAGLPQYFTLFLENGVEDMETLRLLTANDIAEEMGIENQQHIERLTFAVEEEKSEELSAAWTVCDVLPDCCTVTRHFMSYSV